jgi:hypothetical protein
MAHLRNGEGRLDNRQLVTTSARREWFPTGDTAPFSFSAAAAARGRTEGMDSRTNRVVTVADMARLCGVRLGTIRHWIKTGAIAAPSVEPVTRRMSYTREEAARIVRWYAERAAAGRTRGPGSAKRREAARATLASVAP